MTAAGGAAATRPRKKKRILDIEVSPGRVEKIELREGDDVLEVAERFVRKHGLRDDDVRKVAETMKTKPKHYEILYQEAAVMKKRREAREAKANQEARMKEVVSEPYKMSKESARILAQRTPRTKRKCHIKKEEWSCPRCGKLNSTFETKCTRRLKSAFADEAPSAWAISDPERSFLSTWQHADSYCKGIKPEPGRPTICSEVSRRLIDRMRQDSSVVVKKVQPKEAAKFSFQPSMNPHSRRLVEQGKVVYALVTALQGLDEQNSMPELDDPLRVYEEAMQLTDEIIEKAKEQRKADHKRCYTTKKQPHSVNPGQEDKESHTILRPHRGNRIHIALNEDAKRQRSRKTDVAREADREARLESTPSLCQGTHRAWQHRQTRVLRNVYNKALHSLTLEALTQTCSKDLAMIVIQLFSGHQMLPCFETFRRLILAEIHKAHIPTAQRIFHAGEARRASQHAIKHKLELEQKQKLEDDELTFQPTLLTTQKAASVVHPKKVSDRLYAYAKTYESRRTANQRHSQEDFSFQPKITKRASRRTPGSPYPLTRKFNIDHRTKKRHEAYSASSLRSKDLSSGASSSSSSALAATTTTSTTKKPDDDEEDSSPPPALLLLLAAASLDD